MMLQFEKHAEKYLHVRDKIYPSALYKKLASYCINRHAALDLACGHGVSTAGLKPYFQNVTGVDIGENLISYARETFPNIEFNLNP